MSALYDVEEEKKIIFTKNTVCACCGEKFDDIRVMSSKLRRADADQDLRPRFKFIDTLKYGVTACPHCGYTALKKNFSHIEKKDQYKIKEKVSAKFVAREPYKGETMDYSTAIVMHQLALINLAAMDAKLSDQAHMCLQIAWLLRGQIEEAEENPGKYPEAAVQQMKEKEERFYKQAYDGLSQAALVEEYPIGGMNQTTLDYLLAAMGFHFKEYTNAARHCTAVLVEKGISATLKDKALSLKTEILEAKKEEEGEDGDE